MPKANHAASEFLQTRRSHPAKTLTTPVPTVQQLAPILTAAARTPDHGKLEPWRFIVLQGDALGRLAKLAKERGGILEVEPSQLEKGISQYRDADLAVVVVLSPKASPKVPAIEQTYSAGAACLAMLNAALAAGWGANWLSGWASHDREFITAGFGLEPHETVAGVIHIGTETNAPPERPRPDVDALTTWMSK